MQLQVQYLRLYLTFLPCAAPLYDKPNMKFLISLLLPDELRLRYALARIKGLGKTMSLQICDELGISKRVLMKSCLSKDIESITSLVSGNYVINTELISETQAAKARLRYISAYRALRASRNLPCRGQRTRSNAMTCRRYSNKINLSIHQKGKFYQKKPNKK